MTLEEFKTLKPGDKVKIIDTPVSGTGGGVEPMDKWCGKIMTVHKYHERILPFIHMEEDLDDIFCGWCWYPWMIEKKVTEEDSPPPDGIELLKRENADLKDEIVRLKARLFDYMDKK